MLEHNSVDIGIAVEIQMLPHVDIVGDQELKNSKRGTHEASLTIALLQHNKPLKECRQNTWAW